MEILCSVCVDVSLRNTSQECIHKTRLACIVMNICVYTHTQDYMNIVYEVLLLPKNTVSEAFLHKSGVLWSVGCIFITGALAWQWMREYVTLDKKF